MKTLVPTESVEKGFGNFGQLGIGNNETLGDEVQRHLLCARDGGAGVMGLGETHEAV